MATTACRVLRSTGMTVPQGCPSSDVIEAENNKIDALSLFCYHNFKSIQGIPGCNPPTNSSCQEIHHCFPSAPSGNYQLQLANGTVIETYCDMEGSNCGGEGGWTRVAFVNMTEPGTTCPEGLAQRNFSGQFLCSRDSTGCQGTMFPTFSLNYCQVCGRLRGYQFGTPEAFVRSILISSLTIDSQYLDGVSITHGNGPRRHIWTYAVGATTGHTDRFGCPCNDGSTVSAPTAIVGSNYYCESAPSMLQHSVFFPNDVMWDGQQCTGSEGPCCSDNPNLPWFNTTLPMNTNDDIELRVCGDEDITTEGTPLELIEIYIR